MLEELNFDTASIALAFVCYVRWGTDGLLRSRGLTVSDKDIAM